MARLHSTEISTLLFYELICVKLLGQGADGKIRRTKGTWKMVCATALTAEEEGVDLEDQVVDVVVVVEVLVQEHSLTVMIHRLPRLLMVLIGPLKPGQVVRNNNKVFKNLKWVSLSSTRNYFSSAKS